MEINLLIVDDHVMMRKALCHAVADLGVRPHQVQEAFCLSGMMQKLKQKSFSHLILDLCLPDGFALEVLPNIRSLYPDLHILIFSSKYLEAFCRTFDQHGIHWYLSKGECEEVTNTCLTKFFHNERPPMAATKMNYVRSPFELLSWRECEVLHYLLAGTRTKEIAGNLNLKENTVSTLKGRILEKIGVTNVVELIALYDIHGTQ